MIRLSVMAMTRRGGEEGVCAFPLSEWLSGGPWETARPIRTGLVMCSGGRVGESTVSLEEEVGVNKGAGEPDGTDSRPKEKINRLRNKINNYLPEGRCVERRGTLANPSV